MMHCPKCGQQQLSEETRFCSRCGFLLTGVGQLVANDGILPSSPSSGETATSPRWRGIKHGLFIFLLTFLVVPLVAMLTVAANFEPIGVAIAAILLTMGGLLRIVYAFMFESNQPGGATLEQNILDVSHRVLGSKKVNKALPAAQSIPVSTYAPPTSGMWRDTNELAEPGSVTDNTTKLLSRDEKL